MIVRAEMRMATEIDAGPARGELASGSDGRPSKASDIPTLSDLGVRRDQLHEWREVRDAGEGVVEDAIQSALADGRAPTKADIKRTTQGTVSLTCQPCDVVDVHGRP